MDSHKVEIKYFPLPMRGLSNGEFDPPPQTREQQQVKGCLLDLAKKFGLPHGLGPGEFLRTPSGMAAAFIAMNKVYGNHFNVSEGEAADLSYANQRAADLSDQFIFDDQLHFVHQNYKRIDVLLLRVYAKLRFNPGLKGTRVNRASLQFPNFFKEVFLQSDTKVGLLSSATADKPENWFLTNHQIAQGRDAVNNKLGGRRFLSHALFAPRHPNWLDEIDRALDEYKPDAWKGYPVGDPFHYSRFPFRLDDDKLVYPAYEKFLKAGIKNVCIHKGLLPASFFEHFANWRYGSVDDVPKAAKDWPDLNFVIYHAAYKASARVPWSMLRDFEKNGHIEWVSELAEIPQKHGINNIYADLGTTFGFTAVMHPRIAAAILGILIKGLGEDHILWGTDSTYYGSPQWQIEALRRLEMPEDLQAKFGYSPLGGPRSQIKEKILGRNGARLYGLDPEAAEYSQDLKLQEIKKTYAAAGSQGDKYLSELFSDCFDT
jgi:predicted TIM-barrel fold metal-dependent hydrolase